MANLAVGNYNNHPKNSQENLKDGKSLKNIARRGDNLRASGRVPQDLGQCLSEASFGPKATTSRKLSESSICSEKAFRLLNFFNIFI
jgi:hypothetical protein